MIASVDIDKNLLWKFLCFEHKYDKEKSFVFVQ